MTATPDVDLPSPSSLSRDNDGRLVALSFDSPTPPAPGANTWLIAVDGSRHSQQAVAEAIRLAEQMHDCRLQLVHVQHWMSREAAERELAQRGWAASREARSTLDAHGLAWRLHVVMGDCAESIIRIAREQGCRGIVIGSRGLGAAVNILIGSVAEKVIHLSSLPVLVTSRNGMP